ncbi:MAG TPA: hypothetical protein ENJ20_08040 [Bacteroidetes bacterium]|nr:hypothetical protein [Bacteroidota bacterium]
MKINRFFSILFLALLPTLLIGQQTTPQADSTGLPGDHFSLEGALELFKKASSPEQFEELLNKEDNYVNNLDLNEDGKIDYIRVVDNMDGDVHAIVLQVPVNEKEQQDVAVIEIERKGDEEAILQIIGDELLYGQQTIVEPFETDAKDDGRGPSVSVVRIVVNVYFWPCVRFMYRPAYRVWVSPFYWGYYPRWWRPWRPRPWRVYHTHVRVWRPHYRVATTHRVVHAHRVYTPRRKTSSTVHTRTVRHTAAGKKAGVKRTTTTTTVKGKNGKSVTRTQTTTAAGVKGKNGKAAGVKKSTTRTTATGPKGGTVTKKKTTTAAGVKGKNGKAAGVKKSTTRTTAKGPKGGTVTKKKTTTAARKKGRRGATGTKRTKTTVKKKRRG